MYAPHFNCQETGEDMVWTVRQRTAVERRSKSREFTWATCNNFGTFKIVPDRNQFRSRDVFFLDFDYWSIEYLRPFKTDALSKTGDSVRQMLIVEYGLQASNEASSGFLADLS